MTLTPEQFNKLATKEDLKEFASRKEVKAMFKEIMASINIIAQKVDHIEKIFISDSSFRA